MPKRKKKCVDTSTPRTRSKRSTVQNAVPSIMFEEGESVLARLDCGIWWPGYMNNGKFRFWDEETEMQVKRGNVIRFQENSSVIQKSQDLIQSKKYLHTHLSKFLKDVASARRAGGTYVRPKSDHNTFFINFTGNRMTAGDVAHALTVELAHAGVEKRVNCTKFRHTASSLVSALLEPEDRRSLADLMSHSEQMQQKRYVELNKLQQKVRISGLVRKMLTGSTITNDDLKSAEFELPGFDLSSIDIPRSRSATVSNDTQTSDDHTHSLNSQMTSNGKSTLVNDSQTSNDHTSAHIDSHKSTTTSPSLPEQEDHAVCMDDVEPCVKGRPLPSVEQQFLIEHFAREIVEKAKLSTVRSVVEREPLVEQFVEKKWSNMTQETRLLRLRNLLRSYNARPDVLAKALTTLNKK